MLDPTRLKRHGPGALRTAPLLLAIALAALLAACTSSESSTPSPTPTETGAAPTAEASQTPETTSADSASAISVTDSDGVELTFERPPSRIISFSAGTTEVLFAIGAGDQVVAVDEWSNYPAEVESLDRVAYIDADPEAILALNPDLLLMSDAQQPQVAQLRSLGLNVMFTLEPDGLEGTIDRILQFGLVTGHDAEADALATDMRARIDAVEATIADVEEGPRVFYELSNDLFSVAPDSFIGGILAVLKAQNVAAGAETAFPQLTAEAVIAADPEVILLADAPFGESLETVAARPGWDAVDAVLNGRVYGVEPDTGNRAGPRIVDSLEEVAALLYPDRFGAGE